MRILIVDDDFLVRRTLRRIVERLGAAVTDAESAEAALHMIDASDVPFDIIFCDLQMPDRDGVQMLRDLAARDVTSALVLLSGQAQDILTSAVNTAHHHHLNVLGQLSKPFERSRIAEFLTQAGKPRGTSGREPARGQSTTDDIAAGLRANQFEIALQPKVSATTRQLDGLEALVRWRHPDRGLIAPAEFITLAEDSGQIDELTNAVLRLAVAEQGILRQKGLDIPIAVNLSARSMTSLDLADRLLEVVRNGGGQPSAFVFEVTESCLADNMAAFLETATRLRLMGFRLSIDDFGTGFSTLEQVSRLPVTEIKIDRAFVGGAPQNSRTRNILEASLSLCRNLGLKCVCEGVETEAEWDLVRNLGTDSVQGFYVAKPMAIQSLVPWIFEWTGAAAPGMS